MSCVTSTKKSKFRSFHNGIGLTQRAGPKSKIRVLSPSSCTYKEVQQNLLDQKRGVAMVTQAAFAAAHHAVQEKSRIRTPKVVVPLVQQSSAAHEPVVMAVSQM